MAGGKLTILAGIAGYLSGVNDLSDPVANINQQKSLALSAGTGAGKADQLFSDRRTLAASASESLDLAGGLTDAFGQALNIAKVAAIMISASAANANNVVVGGAGANGFSTPFADPTDKLVLKPGATVVLMCDAGYAVTAATGDLLQVANSGAGSAVTYEIVIVGKSA